MRRIKDESTKHYGQLTVLGLAGRLHGGAAWLCRCDCGKEIVTRGQHLRDGQTKSCGCIRKALLLTYVKRLNLGEAAFNAIFRRMRSDAERRGHNWKLSRAEVRQLTSARCSYCGAEPVRHTNQARYNGEYPANGIDRVDNERGYTIYNVVSCCARCNRAKATKSKKEFLDWIGRVYKHSQLEKFQTC